MLSRRRRAVHGPRTRHVVPCPSACTKLDCQAADHDMDDIPYARIRSAARRHAGVPYPHEPPPSVAPAELDRDSLVAMSALFEQRLSALRAPDDVQPSVIRVGGADEAASAVRSLIKDARVSGDTRDDVLWWGDEPPAPREWRLGVTPALALIAATGSVIVDLPAPPRGWSSLLVDTHVVVAGADQLLPDLAAFYETLASWRDAGRASGCQVCVTGCSRTADIEKRLVIPAHGPRRVCVVMCSAAIDWKDVKALAACRIDA